MREVGEDQEDRTRGFVPPEPRGLGLRWIAIAAVVVLGVALAVYRLLPSAESSKPVPALHQPSAK